MQTSQIAFMPNRQAQKSWIEKLQGTILSIATAALIGNFTFLWKLNALASRLEDHDIQKTNAINDIRGNMNTMQLNMQDIKERVIRIESRTKH